MKPLQDRIWFVSAIASSLLALVLLILIIYNNCYESSLMDKRAEFNQLQSENQRGAISQQYLQNIVQDLTPLAASKPEVQALLTRHGITLKKELQNR